MTGNESLRAVTIVRRKPFGRNCEAAAPMPPERTGDTAPRNRGP